MREASSSRAVLVLRLRLAAPSAVCGSHHPNQGPKDHRPHLRFRQDGELGSSVSKSVQAQLPSCLEAVLTRSLVQVVTGAKSEDDAKTAGRKVGSELGTAAQIRHKAT